MANLSTLVGDSAGYATQDPVEHRRALIKRVKEMVEEMDALEAQ